MLDIAGAAPLADDAKIEKSYEVPFTKPGIIAVVGVCELCATYQEVVPVTRY